MPERGTAKKAAKRKPAREREKDARTRVIIGMTAAWLVMIYLVGWSDVFGMKYTRDDTATSTAAQSVAPQEAPKPVLDKKAYDAKLEAVANYASTTSSTTKRIWPTDAPYPLPGALLPSKRIIAYYGNF
jgi:hypothetical protein